MNTLHRTAGKNFQVSAKSFTVWTFMGWVRSIINENGEDVRNAGTWRRLHKREPVRAAIVRFLPPDSSDVADDSFSRTNTPALLVSGLPKSQSPAPLRVSPRADDSSPEQPQISTATVINLHVLDINEYQGRTIRRPPPPEQRPAFLAHEKEQNCCRFCREYKLHDWDATNMKLGMLLTSLVSNAQTMHEFALNLLRNLPCYILRLALSVGILALTIYRLNQTKDDIDIMSYFLLFMLTIYELLHSMYTCHLKGIIHLETCCDSDRDAKSLVGTLFTLAAASLILVVFLQSVFFLNSNQYPLNAFGIAFIIILIVLSLLNAFVIYLIIIIMVCIGLSFLLLLFLFYVLCYAIYYVWTRKCIKESAETAIEKRKALIVSLLHDLSVEYLQGDSTASCAICLREFERNEKVVMFDCSINHVLHPLCGAEWLLNANMCPICRAPVLPSTVYNTSN